MAPLLAQTGSLFAHAGSLHGGLLALHLLPLLAISIAAAMYVRAIRVLAGRGHRVRAGQQACFFAGLALVAIALLSGLDPLGERSLVSAHMAQHLLLADLSGPLLLLGVRSPVLYFLWPRRVLVAAARSRRLRRAWNVLVRPPVALSTWLVVLYAWHIPAAYQAALANPALHAIEHALFAFTGMLAWWPLLDPTRHRTQGRIWKAAYVLVARTVGGALGVALVVWPTQLYPRYGDAARHFGMSPLRDQQWAGAMMMTVDLLVIVIGVIAMVALIDDTDGRGHSRPEQPEVLLDDPVAFPET